MEEYIWNIMSSGATDALKSIVGKSFNKLQNYFTKNKQDEFYEILSVIMESNDEIKKKLELLKNGDSINQNHSGTGDNVVGGKTTIIYNIPNAEDKNDELSIEAEELLKEVSESSKRTIKRISSISEGLHIQVDNKSFTEDVDERTANKYIEALDELIRCKFVKPRGEIYNDITEKGYKYFEK